MDGVTVGMMLFKVEAGEGTPEPECGTSELSLSCIEQPCIQVVVVEGILDDNASGGIMRLLKVDVDVAVEGTISSLLVSSTPCMIVSVVVVAEGTASISTAGSNYACECCIPVFQAGYGPLVFQAATLLVM